MEKVASPFCENISWCVSTEENSFSKITEMAIKRKRNLAFVLGEVYYTSRNRFGWKHFADLMLRDGIT